MVTLATTWPMRPAQRGQVEMCVAMCSRAAPDTSPEANASRVDSLGQASDTRRAVYNWVLK
jgi:hypothetical protein